MMEGKAALFKRFGDIDAWPLCLDTQDVDEIINVVHAVAPGFAGINLEDISAPRCFEIERRLRQQLDIPVFHDDQHGTAIVVLAALYNALRVVDKQIADVRIVMSGAGAAGTAVIKLLLAAGARNVVVADIVGVVHRGRDDLTGELEWLAHNTNQLGFTGSLREAVVGADVFIGVSAPGVLSGSDVAAMADRSIVFALANPDPEVDPAEASRYAAVVATGRSDFPNQINNVLAFPGVFRGLLDAHCARDHHDDAAGCCPRACRCCDRRRAQRRLHHAECVPCRGASHRGGGSTQSSRGADRITVRHRSRRLGPCRTHACRTTRRLLVAAWLAPGRRRERYRGGVAAVGALPCQRPAPAGVVSVRRQTRTCRRLCAPGDVDLAGGRAARPLGWQWPGPRNDARWWLGCSRRTPWSAS